MNFNEEEVRTEAKSVFNHVIDYIHDHPKTALTVFGVIVVAVIILTV